VVNKQVVGGAIFTKLQHTQLRKLPAHSHEPPFFCLVFGADYAEKYGCRDVQFRPFTFAYRPAGVPHQDEVGRRRARMFGIEVERGWQRRVKQGSGDPRIANDFEGGTSIWLALKLYSETRDARLCSVEAGAVHGRSIRVCRSEPLQPHLSRHHGNKPGRLSRNAEQERDYFCRVSAPPPILTQWLPPSVEYSDHQST
jgi:hypothetical protein